MTKETPSFRSKHGERNPMEEGVVEKLVLQGRTPVIDRVSIGEATEYHCYIPSKDTQRGDLTGYFAGIRFFKSPTGEMRGRPRMFTLTESQVNAIEGRIDATLVTRKL